MKKFGKIVALALAVMLLALSLAGCGESAAKTQNSFNTIRVSRIDEMNWYTVEVFGLVLNSDNTYELTYQDYIFGTTDPGSMAFSIRCDVSSLEFLRSMFILNRGLSFALAVNSSNIACVIFIMSSLWYKQI